MAPCHIVARFFCGSAILGLLAGCAGIRTSVVKKPSHSASFGTMSPNMSVDYLAIGSRALLAAVEPLLMHRERSGLRVKRLILEDIVPLSDVTEDATAPILAAIRSVATRSGPSLRFVLLVGDAPGYNETDPERQLLPTFYRRKIQYWDDDPFERERPDLRDIREKRRHRFADTEYATDWPYALAHVDAPGQSAFTAKANPKPLAVGRIPARKPDEAAAFAHKVIWYETAKSEGLWRRSMTIFTGPANFGPIADFMIENTMTRTLDEKVPYDWDVDVIFPKLGSPWAYPFPDLQDKLISRLDAGTLIAGYVGHGAPTHFDDVHYNYNYYQIGSTWDLERLRIGAGKPFFIALTCSNGFFDMRERIQSIAEVLVLNPGGAIAAFAASRVSHPYPNALYGDALVQTFVEEHAPTVGEGVVTAKERMRQAELPLAPLLFDSDPAQLTEEHVGLYNLFGDPATILQYPTNARMTLEPQRNSYSPNSSVDVAAEMKEIRTGNAFLTIETKRSVVRANAPSAFLLQQMPEEEMWTTVRDTYEAASNKVVLRVDGIVVDGFARFQVKLPQIPGDYVAKIFMTGNGNTSTGHIKLKVVSSEHSDKKSN